MAKGTVKWFNRAKGYGFIEPEDGSKDRFVHISAVIEAGMDTLQEGQKLEYELVTGENDREAASNLVALEEQSRRTNADRRPAALLTRQVLEAALGSSYFIAEAFNPASWRILSISRWRAAGSPFA